MLHLMLLMLIDCVAFRLLSGFVWLFGFSVGCVVSGCFVYDWFVCLQVCYSYLLGCCLSV